MSLKKDVYKLLSLVENSDIAKDLKVLFVDLKKQDANKDSEIQRLRSVIANQESSLEEVGSVKNMVQRELIKIAKGIDLSPIYKRLESLKDRSDKIEDILRINTSVILSVQALILHKIGGLDEAEILRRIDEFKRESSIFVACNPINSLPREQIRRENRYEK